MEVQQYAFNEGTILVTVGGGVYTIKVALSYATHKLLFPRHISCVLGILVPKK